MQLIGVWAGERLRKPSAHGGVGGAEVRGEPVNSGQVAARKNRARSACLSHNRQDRMASLTAVMLSGSKTE